MSFVRKGGIFGGGLVGLGAAGGMDCSGPTLVSAIQQALKTKGAPLLKVTGQWDGCTASAWRRIVGTPAPNTADDVEAVTGSKCTSGYVVDPIFGVRVLVGAQSFAAVAPNCPDGSDKPGPGLPVGGQCPAGSTNVLGVCVPTGGGGGGTKCPAGQSEVFGFCVPTTLPGQNPPTTTCPDGSVYDPASKQCVKTPALPAPPSTACLQKCANQTALTLPWIQCLGNCMGAVVPVPPGTTCPEGSSKNAAGACVYPVPPSPGLMSIFGDKLPYIVGALVIGAGAILYFGGKKKPAPARPNRKRRAKRRAKRVRR